MRLLNCAPLSKSHTLSIPVLTGRAISFGPEDITQAAKRLGYLREGKEIKDAACRQELKP
jgi:hypothetical protein